MARPKLPLPDYIKEINTIDGIRWSRVCPECGENIIHKTLPIAKMCCNQKRKCQKCGCPWAKGQTKENNESLRKMGRKVSKFMKQHRKTNPPWNKGLTKNENEILKKMGENHIGFNHDEKTKKIIGKYAKKCWNNKKYREKCLKNLTEYNEKRLKEIIEKYGSIDERNGQLYLYYRLVWRYTNKNNLETIENYDKWINDDYHLDHKYSIVEGFENKIAPEIVGSIHNLQFIPSHENLVKHKKCSITKEELLRLYENKN